MRRLRVLTAVVLASALCALEGRAADDGGLSQDEAALRFESVLRRGADVFASTPLGVYRATLASKRWARLPTPPEMPPGGAFGQVPEGSPLVFYVARRVNPREPEDRRYRDGVYLSKDDGATWERVAEGDHYRKVLLLPGGALFATTEPDIFSSKDSARVYRSTDLGKTWREITGKPPGMVYDIFPDPDHPGLVCLRTSSLRSYIGQADDETYRWKFRRDLDLYGGQWKSTGFFHRSYASSTTLYMLHASLSNYFRFDFGDETSLPSFEIVPRGDRFVFRRGDRPVVPVRVVFRENYDSHLAEWKRLTAPGRPGPKPTPTTISFVDQRDGTDLWGVRFEKGGERTVVPPAAVQGVTKTVDGPARGARRARSRSEGGYEVVWLNAGTSHDREIDLSRLADFSKAGEYRVQLSYDSVIVANPALGEWGGRFTSPVFRVVIKDAPDGGLTTPR